MNRQTEKIALIGGGLVAWMLLRRKAAVVPAPSTGGGPTTVPGTSQQSGAAVGRLKRSDYEVIVDDILTKTKLSDLNFMIENYNLQSLYNRHKNYLLRTYFDNDSIKYSTTLARIFNEYQTTKQQERAKALFSKMYFLKPDISRAKRLKIPHAEIVKEYNQYSAEHNELNKGIDILVARWKQLNKNKIGAIYPEIPTQFFECSDGTYTDKNSRRACTRHGGLKSGEAIPTGGGSNFVQEIPLSQIYENTEWFQNRQSAYSTRSVEAIVAAVLEGRFVWTNFDPVQLWVAPDGKLYVLSGHSRTEAFKRLAGMGIVYQGKGFDRIPAKVETNLSLAEAQKVARESNTLSTPETALERAAYYRRLRATGEFTLRQLEEQAKRTEGRNAAKVLAFSFLNQGGKTYNALEALQTADAASFANIETVAQWIGNARKALPQLSNSHENELYDWLVQGGGYGTRPGQVNSELAFKNELQKIIFKRTEFGRFAENEPLNITSARYASPVEQEYNAQVAELQRSIADLEKQRKAALQRYAKEATPAQMAKILQPIEAALRRDGQELQRLLLNRNNIMDAAKNQASLFGLRRRA